MYFVQKYSNFSQQEKYICTEATRMSIYVYLKQQNEPEV